MRQSPNRLVAVIFGAVYVLVGLLGFAFTGGVGFIATQGGLLLGIFEVNPLHNIAHLLIGAALLIAGLSNARAAKGVNITVGAVYLLLGIVGLLHRLAGQRAQHPRAERARPLPAPRQRGRAPRRRPLGRQGRPRSHGLITS